MPAHTVRDVILFLVLMFASPFLSGFFSEPIASLLNHRSLPKKYRALTWKLIRVFYLIPFHVYWIWAVQRLTADQPDLLDRQAETAMTVGQFLAIALATATALSSIKNVLKTLTDWVASKNEPIDGRSGGTAPTEAAENAGENVETAEPANLAPTGQGESLAV